MVSYRREDSKWIAGRIFDRLEDHYGKGNVFIDIDTIPVGLDFREQIQHSLTECDVLVAIIGPRWLGTDEQGHHAISDDADWVRLEIETALAKKIPVIPVLIDRTRLPKASELPESLRNLAFRQAAEVDTGLDFRPHVDRLIRSMDKHLEERRGVPAPTADLRKSEERGNAEDAIARSQSAGATVTADPRTTSLRRRFLLFSALGAARSGAVSWFAIITLLVVSELLVAVSERLLSNDRLELFIVLAPLPFALAAFIAIGSRVLGYLASSSDKTANEISIAAVSMLIIAAVPCFFYSTHPPEHYAAAAAWPCILLGGLGLLFITVVLISNFLHEKVRTQRIVSWFGLAIFLLACAWIDSSPKSTYLPMIDWRVRGSLIFTCISVGFAIVLGLSLGSLFRFARRRFGTYSSHRP
jgi:hypothetical protein